MPKIILSDRLAVSVRHFLVISTYPVDFPLWSELTLTCCFSKLFWGHPFINIIPYVCHVLITYPSYDLICVWSFIMVLPFQSQVQLSWNIKTLSSFRLISLSIYRCQWVKKLRNKKIMVYMQHIWLISIVWVICCFRNYIYVEMIYYRWHESATKLWSWHLLVRMMQSWCWFILWLSCSWSHSLTCAFNSISDLYEGTRTARVPDFSGIRQILLPLEESGALVRRTDQEVCTPPFSYF